jgi:hypothetical protein
MGNLIGKREFLVGAAGLGLGASAALAQPMVKKPPAGVDDLGRNGAIPPPKRVIPTRKAKTTKLFLTPPGWPNAIAVDPDKGFWVQEQRHDGKREDAWLLDWNGKLLKTVTTNSQNTSGMTYGDGCIWSGANGVSIKNHPTPPVDGIFQTDMNSKQISHRQIPFGPADDGGACHGVAWQNGKLWVSSNRLESLVRLDPKSWQVDWMFPHTSLPDLKDRIHGIEWDPATPDFLWQVSGTQKTDVPGYAGYTPKLVKYEIKTGEVVEVVEFGPDSCDPHDIAIHNGIFYGVDAGEHPGWPIDNPAYQRPGWPPLNSPYSGYVFRIDIT